MTNDHIDATRGESAYGARKEVTADSVRADCTTGDEKETKRRIKCDRGLVKGRQRSDSAVGTRWRRMRQGGREAAHRHTQTQLSVPINLLHFVPFHPVPPSPCRRILRLSTVWNVEIESKLATLSKMEDATQSAVSVGLRKYAVITLIKRKKGEMV